MPYTHLHKGDFFVLCIVGILAIGLLLCPHLSHTGSGTRYPLTDERTIPLTHNGYTLSVTIANGAVSITASDCPDRVCVKTGEIAAVGSVIVCVPANVIVQIGGAEEADYVAG